MKNLIIYKADPEAKGEIAELFHSKGYSLHFADTVPIFVAIMGKQKMSKACLFVQNLSDIRLLSAVRTIGYEVEVIIIVPQHLYDIIQLLRTNDYTMIKDISELRDDLDVTIDNSLTANDS